MKVNDYLLDLRKKNTNDLEQELYDLYKSLFSLKIQKASGQTTKNHLFNETKRNIARVKTILSEKYKDEK